jgi:hypothetical protein
MSEYVAEKWLFVPDEHGGHMLSSTGDKWYPESFVKSRVEELEASVKRNQEWLAQKSNDKVEALNKLAIAEHERDIWHEKYDALLDEKIAKGRFIEFRKGEP